MLTLMYGQNLSNKLKTDKSIISIGRVMTCVLGMVVNKEREIRNFVKTPYYKIQATLKNFKLSGKYQKRQDIMKALNYIMTQDLKKKMKLRN